MALKMADSTASGPAANRTTIAPEITAALTELASRLERQGVTETPAENAPSPDDTAHAPFTAITAWRESDTTSTIDDALQDGPEIVGEIAAEIAAERGLPRDWLKQISRLAEPSAEDDT